MSGSALRAISLAVALSSLGSVSANADVEVSGPAVGFAGAPLPVTLTRTSAAPDDTFHVRVSTREEAREVRLVGASPVRIDLRLESGETPVVTAPEPVSAYAPSVYPGWLALLPPSSRSRSRS